jgi:hypothetical protein
LVSCFDFFVAIAAHQCDRCDCLTVIWPLTAGGLSDSLTGVAPGVGTRIVWIIVGLTEP